MIVISLYYILWLLANKGRNKLLFYQIENLLIFQPHASHIRRRSRAMKHVSTIYIVNHTILLWFFVSKYFPITIKRLTCRNSWRVPCNNQIITNSKEDVKSKTSPYTTIIITSLHHKPYATPTLFPCTQPFR